MGPVNAAGASETKLAFQRLGYSLRRLRRRFRDHLRSLR